MAITKLRYSDCRDNNMGDLKEEKIVYSGNTVERKNCRIKF